MAKKYSLTGATKAFNTFVKTLMQLGIPTGRVVLLTVPGRRTGQPRSTPLNVAVDDGRRFLVGPYGSVSWVQNVRAAGGRARLKSRGRSEDVRLQEVSPAVAAPLLKKYVDAYRIVRPYFEAKPGDPLERFAAEADKHPTFEILPS